MEGQEGSGGPSRELGGFGRGPVGLEGSGGSPGGLGEIWMGREALPVG